MTIREYKRAESLEEAWQLNQKKPNRILGGMIWLKMETINVGTAIDLSGLGLDTIEETEDSFSIGAMVTLRQLEQHPGLAAYTHGAMRETVRHIVGVQLRNLATVGGSIYSRFGFSDVLTLFMAMDCSVELYKGGIVSLDGCADIDVLHFEPDHAAQHTVGLFLVQLPRFFQSFGPLIFSDRHHSCRFLSFFLCSFILTQISI